jgi:enolase
MHPITSISVDLINDSRNIETLKVTVVAGNGSMGTCMVPSGASTGKYEACELRDDGTSHGGVTKAKENILTIMLPALLGKDVKDQKAIDAILVELDGTPDKSNLGGNSILGVSVACAKAAAHADGKELYEHLRSLAPVTSSLKGPRLYFNLINGGKHAMTNLAFQEYHVVPITDVPEESLAIAEVVQNKLGEIIVARYGEVGRGDEGGYAVPTENIRLPLELLSQAVHECNLKGKVEFALDVAATSFYNEENGMYSIGAQEHTKEELHNTYLSLVESFPIVSIEDPFYEEDFESFTLLRKAVSGVIIVGDDLTVTNIRRLKKAIDAESISGLLVKPNQIGTVSETIETIVYAQENNIDCIVSHRSGETMDDMIADFTEAFYCFGMKSGARGPKEREVKYARLVTIHSH